MVAAVCSTASPLHAECNNFLRQAAPGGQQDVETEKQLSKVVSMVNDDTTYPAVPQRLPWRMTWVLHGALLEHLQLGGFTVAKDALLRLLGGLQLVTALLLWLCAQHAASSRPFADLIAAILTKQQDIQITPNDSGVTIDIATKPSQLVANVFFAMGLIFAFLSMSMNLGAIITLASTWNFNTFKQTSAKWGTTINLSVLLFMLAADCVIVAYISPIWALSTMWNVKFTMCMQVVAAVVICIVQTVIVSRQLEHMGVACVYLSLSDVKYHLTSKLLGKSWATHPAEILAAVKGARDLCETLTWLGTVKCMLLDELVSCAMFWPAGIRVEQMCDSAEDGSKMHSVIDIVPDAGVVSAKVMKHGGLAACPEFVKPLLS